MVAIVDKTCEHSRHTDRQKHIQTYTQVILYLSSVMHCIGQTVRRRKKLTLECHFFANFLSSVA